MIVFKKATDLRSYLQECTQPIGFVPTMGALHAGHISLLSEARADGCLTVCSVFVNPTQFNDRNDFLKYPVSVDADMLLLTDAGCEVLFLPDEKEIYPGGSDETSLYDFGRLEEVLEGAHRPGHFRGVGQVVGRLLEIVQPNRLYMGRKDYQQCLIIEKLLTQMQLEDRVQLIKCDTVREPDGLAMSSRNMRLSERERALAGLLYQCLVSIKTKNGLAPFRIVQRECLDLLQAKGFEPEYVALATPDDLQELEEYPQSAAAVALIAARIGNVRLIDNVALEDKPKAVQQT